MKTIKLITWYFYHPEDFPCMACKENQAVNTVKIDDYISLALCGKCSDLSEDKIMLLITNKEAIVI